MKNIITVLLFVLIASWSFGQDGKPRNNQLAQIDTLEESIVRANWEIYIQSLISGVTFGTSGQMPYVNIGGTDYLYSANLIFDGTKLTVSDLDVTDDLDVNDFIAVGNPTTIQLFGGIGHVTSTTIELSSKAQMNYLVIVDRDSDPSVATGTSVLWQSDGTATGNDGDLLLTTKNSVGASNTIIINKNPLTQNVSNGSKTASFVHDAAVASIGQYPLSTSGAVVVSIHNLESGMMGTIFLDITTNPSGITVTGYTDAGSTAITAGNTRQNTIVNAANEQTSVTYTYANDGTNGILTLSYAQQQ